MLSTVVIILFVLMALCAIVGAIYAYLYFTRINPSIKGHRGVPPGVGSTGFGGGSAAVRPDQYGHRAVAAVSIDDDQPVAPSTHLFLFRKP